MKRKNKMRKYIPFLVNVAIFLIIYFTYIHFRYPVIGLTVEKDNIDQWVVEKVWSGNWADTQSIQKGDIIKQVNGKETGLHPAVERFRLVELADSITIENQELKTQTYTVSFVNHSTTVRILIPLLFAVITTLLAIIIYKRAENSYAATILIYFLLSIGICFLSAFASAQGELVGRLILTLTFPTSLILLIHFLKKYLLKFDIIFVSKRFMQCIYAVNFILVLSFIFVEIILKHPITRELELLNLLLLTLVIVFFSVRIFIKHRFSPGNTAIKIFVSSLVFAFGPFIIFYLIPDLITGEEFLKADYAASFLIIIPIILVYLLMAEKLFNIDFIISRLSYHTLIALPFTLIINVMLSLFAKDSSSFARLVSFFILFFICLVMLLYMKEYLDFKFQNHLFSKKNDFETSLYSIFQKVKYETKVTSLVNHLRAEIKSVLSVKEVIYCELFTKNEGKDWYVKEKYNEVSNYINSNKAINWNDYSIGSLVEITGGYSILLGGNQRYKNVIMIGMRSSKTNFSIREKVWLETLAYFSSILLENFQLIENLINEIEGIKVERGVGDNGHPLWLSNLLFSLAEKERKNLSIDLHDSVLQEQLLLLRQIEQIEGRVKCESLKKDLSNLQEKMLDNIHLVRETCNELLPPFLNEMGLISSIQNLINQTKLRCNFLLKTELDNSIQRLNKDYELTMYRVVQELLNNAMKHSHAVNVSLEIKKRDQIITLRYRDDGIGFNMVNMGNSFKTMGLFGIQERVRSIGGNIQINSAEGEGMSVLIEIREG